jgi:hypothetical protein
VKFRIFNAFLIVGGAKCSLKKQHDIYDICDSISKFIRKLKRLFIIVLQAFDLMKPWALYYDAIYKITSDCFEHGGKNGFRFSNGLGSKIQDDAAPMLSQYISRLIVGVVRARTDLVVN